MKKYMQIIASVLDAFKSALYHHANSTPALQTVFAGRNQAYGAYQLRKTYNETVGKSLLFSFSGIAAFFLLAGISFGEAETVASVEIEQPVIQVVDQKRIKIIAEPVTAVKVPAAIRKTITYLPPVVVPDSKPEPTVTRPTVAEVQTSTSEVGATTSTTGAETGVAGTSTTETGTAVVVTEPVAAPPKNEILDIAEIPAEFEGGEAALLAFLQKNIRYPALAVENGIQGRVYVQFVVELDGQVSQIKVVKDIGGGCGTEALRVAQKMPRWKPAKQNGHLVRTRFTMPVLFKVQG
jgi:periplasmic protein TonB